MIALRVTIAVLAATQAAIAAYLGFGELVPQELRIGLVVASAAIAVLMNQLPRAQDRGGVTGVGAKPLPGA